ncbi:alpha/beta hydrolase [Erythrobacter donghaensis]|uniref:alpha/beta hydrolase n=1 Tax=Erythrobacter donghaensis TaxID=267135 RepID=UPI001FE9C408|nr:alpha/beta fold hydrolase [Erythrobacter donghaensis]
MIKHAVTMACAAALGAPLQAESGPAEVPIEAAGPQGPLAGTMLRGSDAQGPVALIIPGSGPTDRDGNSPLGVRAASYRLLAQGLAAEGITTLRIDKRGMFGSAGAVPDANAVTVADYVIDTAAWVKAVRMETGAPCVWLMGHSEGGLVALAAAQEVENLCGVVLIAAAGRPLGEVIKSQLRANPANAPLIEAADAAIDALAAGRRVDVTALPQPLAPLFNPAVQGFLISTFALDPADLAAKAALPMLIVQGGKDIQVALADAERLKAANPGAMLIILPDANHVLKDVAGDSPADNLAAYQAPDLPLSEGLVAGIAAFVRD